MVTTRCIQNQNHIMIFQASNATFKVVFSKVFSYCPILIKLDYKRTILNLILMDKVKTYCSICFTGILKVDIILQLVSIYIVEAGQ